MGPGPENMYYLRARRVRWGNIYIDNENDYAVEGLGPLHGSKAMYNKLHDHFAQFFEGLEEEIMGIIDDKLARNEA
ncbi:hypothetical protein O1611_g7404 [Lasiodiplodia mahajangana]|uniref:Uncharacterized protein n=1 Tax=Lasiodiplodia mahajangana TaxID=1108764 RepID=A0ACC2JG81_9PEZI|nr:hypothetical protein O1611_g7404 [Lasiodiplodia mahajangana]